jgi:hypothetical protein
MKKKTGLVVDEYGNKVDQKLQIENDSSIDFTRDEDFFLNPNVSAGQSTAQKESKNSSQKKFNSVNSYKPLGKLIYNEDILNKLEDKFL